MESCKYVSRVPGFTKVGAHCILANTIAVAAVNFAVIVLLLFLASSMPCL